MLTAEQVIAAHKSNVEVLFGLTNKAFEGVEKLVVTCMTSLPRPTQKSPRLPKQP